MTAVGIGGREIDVSHLLYLCGAKDGAGKAEIESSNHPNEGDITAVDEEEVMDRIGWMRDFFNISRYSSDYNVA